MKNYGLRVLAILMLLSVVLCTFASCKVGSGLDTEEADAFIEEFFAEVSQEDYIAARSYLHPDRPADLRSHFEKMERAISVDVKKGITITGYQSYEYIMYTSDRQGSSYTVGIETMVDTREVVFTIEVVSNERGYGIYNISLKAYA